VSAGAGTATRRRVPPAVPVVIAAAWLLAVAAEATGRAAGLHHQALVHARLSPWLALTAAAAVLLQPPWLDGVLGAG
jgi:hypothetical protein